MTWDDVCRFASALPGAEASTSWGNPCWKVGGSAFVTLRPLRKADIAALGSAAPAGPTVLVGASSVPERDAIVEAEAPVVFSTPHFADYPAMLIDLDQVPRDLLEDLVERSWSLAAPAAQ
ncbi:MAG: hypothetical protein JWM98_2350 [Thermoleophilia bacterium]|nr:hypothetical protein [Thermoleophilia bacterium]